MSKYGNNSQRFALLDFESNRLRMMVSSSEQWFWWVLADEGLPEIKLCLLNNQILGYYESWVIPLSVFVKDL